MARTWLQIRVDLVGGGLAGEPDPGRVLMVGPSHTFADLAEAINIAFARWDLAHLHLFELRDGRRIGYPDPDLDEADVLDHSLLKVARELGAGDEMSYVFDFGDDWRHRCRVLPDKVDPLEEYGIRPGRPVPLLGWGWIPDQYGRLSPDDEEEPSH